MLEEKASECPSHSMFFLTWLFLSHPQSLLEHRCTYYPLTITKILTTFTMPVIDALPDGCICMTDDNLNSFIRQEVRWQQRPPLNIRVISDTAQLLA